MRAFRIRSERSGSIRGFRAVGACIYLVRPDAARDLPGSCDAGGAQGQPRDPGIAASPPGLPLILWWNSRRVSA